MCPMRLNSISHQLVLDEGLKDVYFYDFIFMQDGASCHTSWFTMLYLKQKNIFLLSDRPPKLHVINIIKNMWSILKTTVLKFNIKSFEDLWNVTVKAWYDIPTETIIHLYLSISRRLKEVVKAKGHHFQY